MPLRWLLGLCLCDLLLGCARREPVKVVIVGGVKSEAAGRHEYARGVELLRQILLQSPDARDARVEVAAYPEGWPSDPQALEGADVLVWYFDGLDRHPLNDPGIRAQVAAAMRSGVGLVTLHQASTVSAAGDPELLGWLGGVREGMFDRTTQWADVEPMAESPVAPGIEGFGYRDEFYPTLKFATEARPAMQAELEIQFRDGVRPVEPPRERATVAWTYLRPGGGRAFGYTGGHYLEAFDQPQVRQLLLNAILWSAGVDLPVSGARVPDIAPVATVSGGNPGDQPRTGASDADWITFQRDPQRTGWEKSGQAPKPGEVTGGSFGLVWESPQLDPDLAGQPPRLYASPLYLDALRVGVGPLRGSVFPVVLAASNTGFVYAINAANVGDIPAGRILWRTRLGKPCYLRPAPLDGIPTGILSTPVIDVERSRIYLTHCDPERSWQAYALDLETGGLLPGWPVTLDEETLNRHNRNAGPERVPPRRKHDFRVQRAALNLSPDGSRLYVGFGETETGWTVSVDTMELRVASAFATQAMPHRGSGGIWGSGGPAVDTDGHVFVATGSGFGGYREQLHDWTQSIMKFADTPEGLVLRGTYTPFNHCSSATHDIDLGSGGVMLIPAEEGGNRLLVVGGKQGNVYLVDRAGMPGKLDARPACDTPAAQDGSFLPPQRQPQFGMRGPLNVFGPYSEEDGAMDIARARSAPAFHRDAQGRAQVMVTGNTRQRVGSAEGKPPSLVRLQVEDERGANPYLRIAAKQGTEAMLNPGPPVVTGSPGGPALVWVLDENARRSASLAGDGTPRPVLYAFDADTLKLLWRSAPGQLHTSGKYNAPAFARGMALVGTDRIQAFAVTDDPLPGGSGDHVAAAPQPVASSMPTEAEIAATDGATLYAQRCAACHDNPTGNIPPRDVIGSHPLSRILEALEHGAMRPQATGLSAGEIHAVARYLKK